MLDIIEKLPSPSLSAWRMVAAEVGEVVSNPTAKKTTSLSGIFPCHREGIRRGVDDAYVSTLGLFLQEGGMGTGDPHHVSEGCYNVSFSRLFLLQQA